MESASYIVIAYEGYILAEFERKFPDGFLCKTKDFKYLIDDINSRYWVNEEEKNHYLKIYTMGKKIIEDTIDIYTNPTLKISGSILTAEVSLYAVVRVMALAESHGITVTVVSDKNTVQKMIKEANSKSNNPEDAITKGYNDIKSRIRWIVGRINRVKNGELILDKDEYVNLMTEWKKLKDLKKKYEEILEELTETMDITINSLGSDMLKIASEVEGGETT